MRLSAMIFAAALTLSAGAGMCATQLNSKTLAVVQTMSYDFTDAGHPGGVLFTVSGMPTGITRFILRANDNSLERHLSLLLKAKELGRTISFTYDPESGAAQNGIVTSIWIN